MTEATAGARIRLAHGGGGTLMQQLIDQELRPLYSDPTQVLHDAARLKLPHGDLAFTTDSYVVQPLEFPGGDIGSLAVTGTANDLAMAGARPLHLSVGLILEEGLELAVLRRLVVSLANTARQCGVTIVTGDTKVVERGKGDGVFINTSGIGLLATDLPIDPLAIEPGDRIFVSGDLGRHGVAILAARHGLDLHPPLASDCAPLWPVVESLLTAGVQLHCLRDLTRGGLASALAELSGASGMEFLVEEEAIPVAPPVARTCELLGFEPLHLANEGRLVAVVPERSAATTLQILEPLGGALIGEVRANAARVLLRTRFGSERVLVPLSGELLPRIC
ncbi:hydrogenase expression/formation protein HypE [Synechococcus sp. J7-Johnson]|uniref:hydrogenase expression/formation protein HypE n=1 Tax=Synechococcus sp. J7-Johnson TaxID=2823737 RepID=UPI0020CDE6CE|nr:hydrogenase expression/formation protein HypE [Synechococcus sp. J7-Johnson]MCP9840750.1 hydrogenase expression/formation protein HypE [Synechococcus sp. J7-Johnson]